MDLAREFREGSLREVILELNLNNSAKRSSVPDRGVGVGQQSCRNGAQNGGRGMMPRPEQ